MISRTSKEKDSLVTANCPFVRDVHSPSILLTDRSPMCSVVCGCSQHRQDDITASTTSIIKCYKLPSLKVNLVNFSLPFCQTLCRKSRCLALPIKQNASRTASINQRSATGLSTTHYSPPTFVLALAKVRSIPLKFPNFPGRNCSSHRLASRVHWCREGQRISWLH